MDAPDGSRHNDAVQPPTGTDSSHFRWVNVALALVSILLTLTVVEAGYRVAAGLPVLRLTNWRNEHLIVSAMSEIKAIPDPVPLAGCEASTALVPDGEVSVTVRSLGLPWMMLSSTSTLSRSRS